MHVTPHHAPAEIIPPDDRSVRLVAARHPFRTERVDMHVPAGLTLAEMLELAQADPVLRRHAHIFIGDHYVPKENWRRVRPKPGSIVTARVVPTGGGGKKNPLRTILTLAVLAASIAFAPALAASIGIASTVGVTLVQAGLGIVGSLIVNAIAPPPRQKLGSLSGDARDSPTLFITGARNQALPFGPVPRVLGTHRMTPPLGGLNYTELLGDEQFLHMLVVWGYGPLEVTDLKIGETPIENFEDVQIETRQGYPGDAALTLYPRDPFQESFSVELTQVGGRVVRTSQPNADRLSVDLTCPQGLVAFDDHGKKVARSVTWRVEYRAVGAGGWTLVGDFTITEKRTSAVLRGKDWAVARGQYEVGLTRLTADSDSTQVFDKTSWTALRTFTNEDPISFPHPVAKTALRIKATGQLSGLVDQLNGVVTSIVKDWDAATETWVERASSNPASLFREVLQGAANARPLSDSRIDLAGLAYWHELNAANGREFNMIIDFPSTVAETLHDVASAGRARPTRRDGQWGVIIDEPQTVPVQHFTPRNSWGFSGRIVYPDVPHGFRVRFVNRDVAWRQDERIVYDDGYNAANATRFEGLQMPGITGPDQIWKDGRFHIAQARLRPHLYSLYADVEHLVCTRGDLVRVTHDMLLIGLASGRIKAVARDASDNVTAITVDEACPMDAGVDYGISIRTVDDAGVTAAVVTAAGEQTELQFASPIDAARVPGVVGAEDGLVGCLFGFGELGNETGDFLVRDIRRGPNFSAQLFFADASPAVHLADTGTIPAYQPNVTIPSTKPPAPQIVDVDSGNRAMTRLKDGTVLSRILVSLAPTAGSVRTTGFRGRYRLSGSAAPWTQVADVPASAGAIAFAPVDDLLTYDVEVQSLGPNEVPSDWVQIYDHLVIGKTQKPPPADTFTVTRQADGTRKYAWTQEQVPADVSAGGGYRIHWYRGVTADLADMAVLPPGLIVGTSLESNELSAGSYTFALTTVDSSGNESEPVFLQVELGDPRLRGVLEQLFDHETGWPGTKTDCFVDGDNVLRAVTAGGWDALPASWDAMAASWDAVLPNASPIRYETLVVDLGADLNFTPLVTVDVGGSGAITIEMKTGSTADGTVAGAYVPAGAATAKRYLQIRVSVAGASPEIRSLEVLVDGETVVEDFEDIDTSAASAGLVERVGTGHFRVQSKGDITTITSARVTSYQNAGAGWTFERIKPAGASGVLTAPYAEFKIYKNGVLADATVDVELKGNR